MAEIVQTRKERDVERRETDFLDAAEKLFAEHGYFQTSMEDVAQEAEYATGTIYRYFPSKEDLYHRILTRKGHLYLEMIKKTLNNTDSPMEKIEAIIHNKVDFFFNNAEFMRIYLNIVNASCDTMTPPEGLQKVHDEYMNIIRDIFNDGIKDGVFRATNVDMLLLAFAGMTNHLLCNTISTEKDLSKEECESFIMNFLKRGLIETKGEEK